MNLKDKKKSGAFRPVGYKTDWAIHGTDKDSSHFGFTDYATYQVGYLYTQEEHDAVLAMQSTLQWHDVLDKLPLDGQEVLLFYCEPEAAPSYVVATTKNDGVDEPEWHVDGDYKYICLSEAVKWMPIPNQ